MSSQPLWSVTQISLASLLAGPLAGCYFLGKNFRAFGSPTYAKWCYLIGFFGTLFFGAIFFLLPQKLTDFIPPRVIQLIYAAIITGYAHAYQKQIIKGK
jgi:hypothetical protein